jgi:hypothetical protein
MSPNSAVTANRIRNHRKRASGSAAMGIRRVVEGGSGFASLGRMGSLGAMAPRPRPIRSCRRITVPPAVHECPSKHQAAARGSDFRATSRMIEHWRLGIAPSEEPLATAVRGLRLAPLSDNTTKAPLGRQLRDKAGSHTSPGPPLDQDLTLQRDSAIGRLAKLDGNGDRPGTGRPMVGNAAT